MHWSFKLPMRAGNFSALALMITAVLAAPLITPQDPFDIANLNLRDALRPPGYLGSRGHGDFCYDQHGEIPNPLRVRRAPHR